MLTWEVSTTSMTRVSFEPLVRVMVPVPARMASLKVSLRLALRATPMALSAGVAPCSTGAVVSGAVAKLSPRAPSTAAPVPSLKTPAAYCTP